jgi:hypothetical protein
VKALIDELGVGVALRLRRADELKLGHQDRTRRRPRPLKVQNFGVRYCPYCTPLYMRAAESPKA